MFKIKDIVMHSSLGVCQIKTIERKSIAGQEEADYFLIEPLYKDESQSQSFIPVANAENILRYPLNEEEIQQLLKKLPKLKSVWINESRARKESFNKLIKEGKPEGLLQIISTLLLKDEEKKESGKRISEADMRQLQKAQKIIHQEMAYTLKKEIPEVEVMIEETIFKKKKK